MSLALTSLQERALLPHGRFVRGRQDLVWLEVSPDGAFTGMKPRR